MRRLQIHVETLILDGIPAEETPALLRTAERALEDLLAGREPALDPRDPAAALALALADAVQPAFRKRP
jgi:hypothetical protein